MHQQLDTIEMVFTFIYILELAINMCAFFLLFAINMCACHSPCPPPQRLASACIVLPQACQNS